MYVSEDFGSRWSGVGQETGMGERKRQGSNGERLTVYVIMDF